jgi:UDP-GlcNAc:undecaprenyl-phosphate GlcNAc-1-phosphate transferase
MVLLLSFVLAMLITMALIPPLMRSARRLQFVDIPDERKVHVGAIPRIGGIAMAVGAVVPMVTWLPLESEAAGVLLGLGVILIFGVWDDRVDLDYRIKFLGQGVAITTIIFYGDVHITSIPFLHFDELPFWVSVALTMFVLLAVTNAINLSDGLDGLAAGTTLLSLGLIVFLAYGVQLDGVSLIGLAVMGSILGFLRFNTHPARIFMGDGGSQFLGLTVGVLALMLTQGERADFSPMLPFLLLGLPLLDTAMVMVKRISEGRSPFSPDRNHIHHRLLALGLNHYEVVLVIYLLQAGLTATAYLLRYAHDATILMAFCLFCGAIITLLSLAQRGNLHLPHISQQRLEQIRRVGRDGLLARVAHGYVMAALPIFMVAGALLASGMSSDIALLSLTLLLLLLFEWWRNREPRISSPRISWLERGVIYIVVAMLLYLAGLGHEQLPLSQLFFGVLVVAVMLGFRYSKDSGFAANPSDFLIIFLAIALPTLPQAQQLAPFWTTDYIPKLVVLYYGIEMVLPRVTGRIDMVRLLTGTTLVITLIRGVL